MANNIIQLSFKNNFEDKLLLDWLENKFDEYGNKSNYIKYILRKEMRSEFKGEYENDKNM